MRQLYIFSIILLLFNNVKGQGTWSTLAALPATGRAFSFAFSIGDTAYVCSGGNLGVTLTDFWAYHPATGTWIQKGTPAFQSRQGACFVVNGKAYMFNGIKFGSTAPTSEVWEYDPATGNWTQKNNFPGGARLSNFSFAIGNKGYTGGGSNAQPGGFLYDFWEYNPVTDTWTQIPNYPIPDYFGLAGFELNGLGYIVGGFGTGSPATVPVNRVWCFNPANNQWTQKNNFPINIGQATGFSAAGNGYILNGTLQLGSNQTKTNTLYKYNSATDSWALQTNFPSTARSATHAVVINDTVYAGQGLGLSSAYYADWYRYVPANVTAVNELEKEVHFILAPNPATDRVSIIHPYKIRTVTIMDMNGKAINTYSEAEEFNVDFLPDGMYMVEVNNSYQKLIVKH